MMRAKMSERGNPARGWYLHHAGTAYEGTIADVALAEAQAILRESEPQAWFPVYSPASRYPIGRDLVSLGQHAQLDGMRESHRALAESLARFVEENS